MKDANALNKTSATVNGRELVVTRLFDAPRELVFQAWTDPEHLPHWWGPRGFTITTHEIDVRPGGVWKYVMHGPDGTDYDNRIVFTEIVRPERLAYSHGDFHEEHFQVTVTFAERGNQTELTMRMLFKSAEELEMTVKQYGAIEGAQQTMDRLAERLAQM